MIKHDIKIGINRLLRFKTYSLINIGGFAVAIASSLVIFLYVYHHLSFDKYVNNGENSYRIISRVGDGAYNTNTYASFGNYLSDCTEIESHTLSYNHHNIEDVYVNDRKIKVNSAIFVNESFLDYFSVKVLEGDIKSINNPNTIMVTPDIAQKLFPNKSAIGQNIFLRSFTKNQDSLIAYSVSGIIEPLPNTSHIKCDMLLSQKGHFAPTVKVLDLRKVFGGLVYVKLLPSTNIKDFEKKLKLLAEPSLKKTHGPPLDAFNYKLQKVYDIHFTQGLINEKEITVRSSFINILILVGILIIFLATINFIIVNIARQSFYQKNTLIIRFFGGTKINLFNQVIAEILISISISFIIAFMLLSILENYFTQIFFYDNSISPQNSTFWSASLILFLLVNLIVLAFTLINLAKRYSNIQQINKINKFKPAILLVVFQFIIVIVLTKVSHLIKSIFTECK